MASDRFPYRSLSSVARMLNRTPSEKGGWHSRGVRPWAALAARKPKSHQQHPARQT